GAPLGEVDGPHLPMVVERSGAVGPAAVEAAVGLLYPPALTDRAAVPAGPPPPPPPAEPGPPPAPPPHPGAPPPPPPPPPPPRAPRHPAGPRWRGREGTYQRRPRAPRSSARPRAEKALPGRAVNRRRQSLQRRRCPASRVRPSRRVLPPPHRMHGSVRPVPT